MALAATPPAPRTRDPAPDPDLAPDLDLAPDPAPPPPLPQPLTAAALLLPHALPYADAEITVASRIYPAHRAILALHSPLLHRQAYPATQNPPSPDHSPDTSPAKYTLTLTVPSLPSADLVAGWTLLYAHLYSLPHPPPPLKTLLSALKICSAYSLTALSATFLPLLSDHVNPSNAIALLASPPSRSPPLRSACLALLKSSFPLIHNWHLLDLRSLVKILKLNDLAPASHAESDVFWAVCDWVDARNGIPPPDRALGRAPLPAPSVPPAAVDSLVKLIRFPTMPPGAAAPIARSPLLAEYPSCAKYTAQIGRAPRRHITIETSPLFRPRRPHSLIFADRISSFSRVSDRMQTSARYFADALWHLVVGRGAAGGVELFLGVLADDASAPLHVELDFTLYVAQMGPASAPSPDDAPPMVRREVKNAVFERSGQKIGFPSIILFDDVPDFARNDVLCIGASLRLNGCRDQVEAIDDMVDHSADAISC